MAKQTNSPQFLATKVTKTGTRKQYFTEMQWTLLGKNKEGWTREADQTVMAAAKPNTGQKKDIVVTPELKEDAKSNEVSEAKQNSQTVTGDEEKNKAAFLLATAEYTKNTIKNILDAGSKSYDKKANLETLQNKLGEFLKWDVTLLEQA